MDSPAVAFSIYKEKDVNSYDVWSFSLGAGKSAAGLHFLKKTKQTRKKPQTYAVCSIFWWPSPKPVKITEGFSLIFIKNGLPDPQNVSDYQFSFYFQTNPLNVKLISGRTLLRCVVLKLDH